jgi:hypothetical protein
VLRLVIAALVGGLLLAGGAAAATQTLTWQTSAPTRARVTYGAGGLYLWSARETAPTTSHSITLTDLAPATTYQWAAGAQSGSFTTAPLAPDARFGTDGTHVTADGSLFFPVLSYWQCAATDAQAVAAGISVFIQTPYTACAQVRPNDFTSDPVPASVRVLSDDYSFGGAGNAGWYLPDEPEAWGLSPSQLPVLPAAPDTGRLRVLNISQHFFSGQAPLNGTFDRDEYRRFAALADVVGFDLYPVAKFCGRVSLLDVYLAQRELMTTYAPGRPTFQWIETGPMTGECPGVQVTPAIVNAESWLAVAGGACAIGYFTNSWTGKAWSRWDLAAGVEAQLARTTAQLRGLAPALCTGTPGEVVVPWDGGIAATSRTLDGALYVIAVNSAPVTKTIPFRVDSLDGRQLTVLGTARTITPAKKVYFRDTFAPYEVHVYVAAPRG